MLRSVKDLENYKIGASDGLIGHVKDFYFDDDTWAVRYFVVETGPWSSPRKVLISPISVHHPDWIEHTLPVSITMEQVQNSPDVDTDKPVSRQNEESYLNYYGYSAYWGGAGMWGAGLYPSAMVPGYADESVDRVEHERRQDAYLRVERARHRNDDPHLRSCNAVVGYHIHAIDGYVGRVARFLVDDETWAIRYLVIDTGHWWAGHKVLVAPPWITGVQWSEQTMTVDLCRASFESAPPYEPAMSWSHDQDLRLHLHRHHGRSDHRADNPVHEMTA